MLNIENNIEPIRAGIKPCTENPGTINETSQNNNAFITNVNRPRVRMFKGKDRKMIIGLINIFTRPIIKVAKRAAKKPAIAIPGTNNAIRIRAIAKSTHLIIDLIMFISPMIFYTIYIIKGISKKCIIRKH